MKKVTKALLAVILMAVLLLTACQASQAPVEDITWILDSYTGAEGRQPVLEDTRVTVIFESEDKEMSGNGGCNNYGGGYEIGGSNLTVVGPVFATEMWCWEEKGAQESAFLEAIQAAETWDVVGDSLTIKGGGWTLAFTRE